MDINKQPRPPHFKNLIGDKFRGDADAVSQATGPDAFDEYPHEAIFDAIVLNDAYALGQLLLEPAALYLLSITICSYCGDTTCTCLADTEQELQNWQAHED